MKKNITFRPKRWLVLLSPLILILLAGGFVIAHHIRATSIKPPTAVAAKSLTAINYAPASADDNKSNDARKGNSAVTPTIASNPTAPGTTGTTPSLSVIITSASAQTDAQNVHVGNLVEGATQGSCTLTSTMAGQADLVRTSTVKQDVNNYSCGVFNIPFRDFPQNGNWKISLSLSNNGRQASTSWADTINITNK